MPSIQKIDKLQIKISIILIILILSCIWVFNANAYTGPTGIEYTENVDSTGGGGILHDIGIDTTAIGTTTIRGCYSATLPFSGYGFGASSFTAGVKGMIDVLGETTPPSSGGYPQDGYYKFGPNNIDTCTDMTDYGSFYLIGGLFDSPVTNSVTLISPEDEEENVDAWLHFTGTYTNDGTYNSFLIGYASDTDSTVYFINCDIAEEGTNIPFSCTTGGHLNSHYQWYGILWNSEEEFSFDDIEGTVLWFGPNDFYTGDTYTPSTPPTSSECESFDVGCYLESAIGWTFSINPETLENFENLTLENSVPFSYIYDIPELWDEVFNAESTGDFALGIDLNEETHIDLISTDIVTELPFFSIFYFLIEAGLYITCGVSLYKHVLKVHDSNHTS